MSEHLLHESLRKSDTLLSLLGNTSTTAFIMFITACSYAITTNAVSACSALSCMRRMAMQYTLSMFISLSYVLTRCIAVVGKWKLDEHYYVLISMII